MAKNRAGIGRNRLAAAVLGFRLGGRTSARALPRATIPNWSRANSRSTSPPAPAWSRSPPRWPAPRRVEASEIDEFAQAAIELNARENDVAVRGVGRGRRRRGSRLGGGSRRRRLLSKGHGRSRDPLARRAGAPRRARPHRRSAAQLSRARSPGMPDRIRRAGDARAGGRGHQARRRVQIPRAAAGFTG